MLHFYKTEYNRVIQLDEFSDGCWISAIAPNDNEITYLIDDLKLDPDFVRSSLDEEESSRIETEDNQTLVIVDIPITTNEDNNTVHYTTHPLGIIITEKNVITISSRSNPIIDEIANNVVKNVQTHLKTRFLLILLFRGATKYLQYLKQIDKISSNLETQLHKSTKNEVLVQLLGLEKSLVYFSTSLKSDEITLEKILRGRVIRMYEDDQDLLEDVLIEVKQAIEMANIYSSTLSRTMDAFSAIISNNLNIAMKILNSITILLQIPSIIFSFYGMNVAGLWFDQFVWFPLIVSIIAAALLAIILMKNKMFK